jgi:hypothetical protein
MRRAGIVLVLVGAACGGNVLQTSSSSDGSAPSDSATTGVCAESSRGDSGPQSDALPFDASSEPTSDASVDGQDGSLCAPVSNLFAYYPLDDDLEDHSGNGYDAMGNVALTSAGKVGGAAVFDGVSSYLFATGSTAVPMTRSLCAWARLNPATGLGQPLFSAGSVGRGDFFSVSGKSSDGGTCPFLPPNTPFVDHWGTPCAYDATLAVPVESWSFVCYIFDGASTLTFYADAVSGTTSGSEYAYSIGSLYFGSTSIGGTTTLPSMSGLLDEITVWSRALTASDRSALWNAGEGCRAH